MMNVKQKEWILNKKMGLLQDLKFESTFSYGGNGVY